MISHCSSSSVLEMGCNEIRYHVIFQPSACLLVAHSFHFIYRLIRISSEFTELSVLHVIINPRPEIRDPSEHRAVPTRGSDPLTPADHTHQRVLPTLLVREGSPTVALTTLVSN